METKYLLHSLDRIKDVLKERRLSIFLDYDGTITPLAGAPEDTVTTLSTANLLKKLATLFPLSIVSGRRLFDLMDVVGIKGITYAGNHGFEIWHEDFTAVFDTGKRAVKELRLLKEKFSRISLEYPGTDVEDKGLTVTVHYRPLDIKKIRPFREAIRVAAEDQVSSGIIRLRNSKMAIEVQPNVDWDKGRAVLWIMERKGFRGTYPIYLGDDQTDKDGCRAVKGIGLSAFVGGILKEADYYLKNQGEVRLFLEWLIDIKS
ncbi:MAG: trehalose-phosphatase [Deltaproteobacteria bacterium]|nr:trehalose-phosphatase [Deltaproteobacteria bacterium]